MKTRCPHCDTLYDIDEATLACADYTAVCCHCHRVFTAEKITAQDTSEVADEAEDLLAHIDETTAAENQGNGEIPARPEKNEWAFVQPNTRVTEHRPPPSQAMEVPDDFNSLAATVLPEDHFSGTHPSQTKTSWLQITSLFLLTLLALAQVAWLNKQRLMEQPQTRQLAKQFCDLAGCTLKQEPGNPEFSILHRDLQPATSHQQALSLTLSFTNSADFSQPLPRLQLNLLDHREQLLAQRTFTPDEYLYPTISDDRIIEPTEIINVELLLQEPGLDTSGFELKFR